MNLAKEQGACEYFNETTYAKGILPIDTYKKDLDSLTQEPPINMIGKVYVKIFKNLVYATQH